MSSFTNKLFIFILTTGWNVLKTLFRGKFQDQQLRVSERMVEYPFVAKNLGKKDGNILDIGCVGSWFPVVIAGLGYSVCGVDIRKYSGSADNFKFLISDARALPFPDNFFDRVMAVSTIEHIGLGGRYGSDDDKGGDKKSVREITRVLKPEGKMIITVPYGIAKIIEPFERIYGEKELDYLFKDLTIEQEEYFVQNEAFRWIRIDKQEAGTIDGTIMDDNAVALIVASKKLH